MGKRRRLDTESEFKTVFLITSLSTNFAMNLAFSDTVGDFKRKIILHHEQCFPKNGAITIHSLKTKHGRRMFHLHDPDMLVSSAFEGNDGCWYLYVDASSSLENVEDQNSFDSLDDDKLDSPMLPSLAIDAIPWRSPEERSRHTGSEVGHVNGTFHEGFSSVVNRELIESDPKSKDDSKEQNEKFHARNSNESPSGGDLKAKKKQKVKHGLNVSGKSAPKVSTDVQQEGTVTEKKEVHRHHLEDLSLRPRVSDTENLSLDMSVMVNKEDMASPDVPSQQAHAAISPSTKKKKKIKRKLQVTNSNVPSANEGGQILRNDENMLTLTENLQNEYREEDEQLSSKHGILLFEDVKTSDLGETANADKSEVSMSKIKTKKSKKSAVQDLSAPLGSHIKDQTMRDEDILTQNDPKKNEMISELAKNHLEFDETNLNEKEPALDILSDVRNDPEEVDKSGSKSKKKKPKKSSSKSEYRVVEHIKDASDPLVLKDLRSECISGDDMMADQRKKEQKIADSPKNVNNDGVNLPLTEVNDDIQSRNEDVVLNSGKDSNFDQTRDKATIQDQVNNENADETKSPNNQIDGERKNIATTPKKRKKKAKKTENSISENLGIIPESNNINDKELDSLVDKLCDVEYNTETMKLNGSEEKRTFDPSDVSVMMGPLPNNVAVKDIDQSQELLETGDNPKVPANEIESNREVNPTMVNMESNGLVYEGGNNSVYFRHYFVSGDDDDHKEAVSTDKVDGETNVIEADEHKIMTEGKSKSSGNQKNSRKKSKPLDKSVEQAVMDNSEEKNGSLNSSNLNSVSRDSKQIITNKTNQKKKTDIKLKVTTTTKGEEASRKKVKDLDKSSQSQEKSLLTTPGLIFGDGSSESSGDENVNLKSAPITQTPSDSSSSSVSEDLMKEAGSINKDHKGSKTPLGSKLRDPKNMPLDMILRSSSRFKKAKLAASQSEAAAAAAAADTDSQQVDFVPESQPI